MSDESKTCDNCGNPIKREIERGRPSRFCSASCRDRYHNRLKRVPVIKHVILNEFSFILDSMLAGGELAEQALDAMQEITAVFLSRKWNIACSNCGQKRLYLPQKGERCDFCGESKWKISILGRIVE
jgi:hypothetical protein